MAATPPPASPAPAAYLSPRSVIRATAWITPRRGYAGLPYYRIYAGADQEPGAAETQFITHDPDLFALASAIEGTDRQVRLQWHPALHGRTTVRILEAIR
jgi:hypothetical protein